MINDEQLLLAWERGYGRAPFEQALILMGISFPTSTVDELMHLSIGQRDAVLLALRKKLFGANLSTLANCPECGEAIELSFSVDDISVPGDERRETLSVEVDGFQIEYRLPTSRDLLVLTRVPRQRRIDQLLHQCVSRVRQQEQRIKLSSLGQDTQQKISQTIVESDPQADIQLALKCVECEHEWSSPFDVVGYLWSELNTWCQRLLAEVHTLAKAYGWSEPEILALGRWRRQIYLGMVRQ